MYFTTIFQNLLFFFKGHVWGTFSHFLFICQTHSPAATEGPAAVPSRLMSGCLSPGDNIALCNLFAACSPHFFPVVGKHQTLIKKNNNNLGLVCILILPTWNWLASFKTTYEGTFPELSDHLIKCCYRSFLTPWKCRRQWLLLAWI